MPELRNDSDYNMNYRGYIYIITNIINGKKYIGRHHRIEGYDPLNDGYLGSGGAHYQNAIRKYGRENFLKEILDEGPYTLEEAIEREKFWISKLNAVEDPNYYNECSDSNPPVGPTKGKNLSEYHKESLSNSAKSREVDSVCIVCGAHFKSRSGRAKYCSSECYKLTLPVHDKCSTHNINKNRKDELRNFILNDDRFNTHYETEEQRIRRGKSISKGKLGHVVTEDVRQKIRDTAREQIWFTDGVTNRRVHYSMESEMIDLGWKRGFTRNKSHRSSDDSLSS